MKSRRYLPRSAARLLLTGFCLSIAALLYPAGADADTSSNQEFTLGVHVRKSIEIAARHLPGYFRAVPPEPPAGPATLAPEDSLVEFKPGEHFTVTLREDNTAIELAKPHACSLSAAIYLGKTVEIDKISPEGLTEINLKLTIPSKGPVLAIDTYGNITCRPEDCSDVEEPVVIHLPPGGIYAKAPRRGGMQPIHTKSFELMDRWVSAGEDVRVRVPIPDLNTKDSQLMVGFWTTNDKRQMEGKTIEATITGIEPDPGGQGIYVIRARVPYLVDLDLVAPQWFSPMPSLVKMTVSVKPGDGRAVVSETFDLRFSRRGWGIAAGLLFIFLVLVLIMIITRDFNPFEPGSDRHTKWQSTYKSGRFVRFFFSPMDIAVTPFGTYSISVTQALFWTFIVAFSCVYVYTLKAAFIAIPAQILLLLGITGGTALASRINSTSRDIVPKELMIDLQRSDIPRLRDMISIAGRLNIYKFQMMVFTIITGIIVLVELIKASNFPEIPDSLIALMGLSNTLYLGNEVTVEPVQGLRDKVRAYKDETEPDKKKAIGDDIKAMLSEF